MALQIAMCILVTRAPASKMTKPSLAELDTVARESVQRAEREDEQIER